MLELRWRYMCSRSSGRFRTLVGMLELPYPIQLIDVVLTFRTLVGMLERLVIKSDHMYINSFEPL